MDESAEGALAAMHISCGALSSPLSSQFCTTRTLRFLPVSPCILRFRFWKCPRSPDFVAAHTEATTIGHSYGSGVFCFAIKCIRILFQDIELLNAFAILLSAEMARPASALFSGSSLQRLEQNFKTQGTCVPQPRCGATRSNVIESCSMLQVVVARVTGD